MKTLGFLFTHSPHSTAHGREGLDAVLATSAYSENIKLFFVGDGVSQLLKQQNPQSVLSRDYIPAFKLLELYDVEDIFVCADSLSAMGFSAEDLILDAEVLEATMMAKTLADSDAILRF